MAKKKKTDQMQALIKSDNSIIKELRDQQWLYNPRVFAQVSGDFSLMHQRVLLGVLEKLQDRIAYSASEHQKNQQLWLPLFSEDEMNTSVDFEIDPRDLGVTPGHYPELQQALSDLISMKIGYPNPKKKGNYVFASLFTRLEMPMTENGWRTGKIRVKMDKENVNDFLSMDRGYTDHVAKIAQFSKKQRTPRIYIYLSTFKYKGRQEVAYPELCEFLGIDDKTYVDTHKADNPSVKETDNPFHKFSKVKKLILEPSRQEMDQFAADKKIEFSFTYEPKYNDGRLKGNPTHIEFVIVQGELGREREAEKRRHNKHQSIIDSLTRWCRDISVYDIQELLREVEDDWLEEFEDYAYGDMRKLVEQKQPDRVNEYAMTLLQQWVKDRKVRERARQIDQERQHILFEDMENERLWKLCMEELRGSFSVTSEHIGFKSFDRNTGLLMLQVSDFGVRDLLESAENIGQYTLILKKYFGSFSKLNYWKPA